LAERHLPFGIVNESGAEWGQKRAVLNKRLAPPIVAKNAIHKQKNLTSEMHGRMAGGGHKLPKVSLGPFLPYLSMPCGRPAAFFYPLGHPTPCASGEMVTVINEIRDPSSNEVPASFLDEICLQSIKMIFVLFFGENVLAAARSEGFVKAWA
jgi:hypothetical protein